MEENTILVWAHRSDCKAQIDLHKDEGYKLVYKHFVGNHIFKMKFKKNI